MSRIWFVRSFICSPLLLGACGSVADLGDEPGVGQAHAALSLAPVDVVTVDLIAVGTLSGLGGDLSDATAAALENGVAGNLLGGIGSGLAYAGGTTFLAVPDRGPNAVSYNALVDDTTSYINRFQTLRLELERARRGSALPFVLSPELLDTTLLYSRQALVYADGADAGLASGEPALNRRHQQFFVGRSDNFDTAAPSTNARDARLDPEGVRVSNDGRSVFISDEYGPYVYEFDRASGCRVRSFSVPIEFGVSSLRAQGDLEISDNGSGRVANKGMEGLAITPDGKTLVGAMQSPLLQDGGTAAAFTRIVTISIADGATAEYAYPLTNIGSADKPKFGGISEILAINEHEFLVDERDGAGLGDDSTASFKRVFRIDLTDATDVTGLNGVADLGVTAVKKTLFLDVVAALEAHAFAAEDIPAKIEGLAFGPDVSLRGQRVHTLFVTNDNDFLQTLVDTNHPAGIDNPNRVFVFAVSDAALPDLVPQRFRGVD
jgi:phytase-like protein